MKTESQHKRFQAPSAPRRRERLAETPYLGITPTAGLTNSQLYTLHPQLVSRTNSQLYTLHPQLVSRTNSQHYTLNPQLEPPEPWI